MNQYTHLNDLKAGAESVINHLRLIDDIMFSIALDGQNEAVEEMLNTILERDDIRVLSVITQKEMREFDSHGVRLDVLATDDHHRLYNIEIQRADDGANVKRARYNASMLDVHATRSGQSYEDLPETFTIFITEHDVLKKDRSIVHIERGILETGESFNDEQHIIYVNAAVDDHTRISQLMHDFLATDYRSMSNTKLAELVKFYKHTKEGRRVMCEAEIRFGLAQRQVGREEGERNIVRKMKEKGFTPNFISSTLEIPLERVKELIK